MTMRSLRRSIGVLLLAAATALAVVAQKPDAPAASGKPAANKKAAKPQDEGERIFQLRCSSCHNAPEGFSPRISGTVVRHMRVRASLSRSEEEALLRFFNP